MGLLLGRWVHDDVVRACARLSHARSASRVAITDLLCTWHLLGVDPGVSTGDSRPGSRARPHIDMTGVHSPLGANRSTRSTFTSDSCGRHSGDPSRLMPPKSIESTSVFASTCSPYAASGECIHGKCGWCITLRGRGTGERGREAPRKHSAVPQHLLRCNCPCNPLPGHRSGRSWCAGCGRGRRRHRPARRRAP
jgi:hypothetical protein